MIEQLRVVADELANKAKGSASCLGHLVDIDCRPARARLPHLRDRVWTGDVMRWEPPKQVTAVMNMGDPVPAKCSAPCAAPA